MLGAERTTGKLFSSVTFPIKVYSNCSRISKSHIQETRTDTRHSCASVKQKIFRVSHKTTPHHQQYFLLSFVILKIETFTSGITLLRVICESDWPFCESRSASPRPEMGVLKFNPNILVDSPIERSPHFEDLDKREQIVLFICLKVNPVQQGSLSKIKDCLNVALYHFVMG